MAGSKKTSAPKRAVRSSKKIIGARNGVRITLDDSKGQKKLILETPAGQTITLNDETSAIEIVDTHGNTIRLDASGVSITASGKMKLQADQVEVSATLLKVEGGTARFSGLLQCDSLVANSVVSASYSPGAGNIW